MIVKELLSIRSMEISDWDKIHSGFIISGENDAPIPIENPFSGQIIKYLLNEKLDISIQINMINFVFMLMQLRILR